MVFDRAHFNSKTICIFNAYTNGLSNILNNSLIAGSLGDMPTYENGHLLDYIITRESSNFASEFIVSDKISDHMALHASLTCQRTHPERKEIFVRSLKRINDEVLMADLTGITIDSECRDVNSIVNHYDNTLSTILDQHAPLKKICIVDRPMNDWINADI